METPYIISIIGHLTESSFLLYIYMARIIDIKVLETIMIKATKQ